MPNTSEFLLLRMRATLGGPAVREDALLALAEDLGRAAEENLRALLGVERAEGIAWWLRLQAATDALVSNLGARDLDDDPNFSLRRARQAAARLAQASLADAIRERS
ncbi:MAG: hypothetical protein U1E65_36250 [Myxococcota bacterium]